MHPVTHARNRATRAVACAAAALGVVVAVAAVGVASGTRPVAAPAGSRPGLPPTLLDGGFLDPGPYGLGGAAFGMSAAGPDQPAPGAARVTRSAVREVLPGPADAGAGAPAAAGPADAPAGQPYGSDAGIVDPDSAGGTLPGTLIGPLEAAGPAAWGGAALLDGLDLVPAPAGDVAGLAAAVAGLAEGAADAPAAVEDVAPVVPPAVARPVLPRVQVPLSSYVLTAGFDQAGRHWRHRHTGLDLAAPTGRPVYAVAGGRVVSAGWAGAYGKRIVVQHPDGTQTWYCHLSRMYKPAWLGRVVRAGDHLGRVGTTGNTTGPHLHLEVRTAGHPVDPLRWLRAHGAAI